MKQILVNKCPAKRNGLVTTIFREGIDKISHSCTLGDDNTIDYTNPEYKRKCACGIADYCNKDPFFKIKGKIYYFFEDLKTKYENYRK